MTGLAEARNGNRNGQCELALGDGTCTHLHPHPWAPLVVLLAVVHDAAAVVTATRLPRFGSVQPVKDLPPARPLRVLILCPLIVMIVPLKEI